MNWTLFCQIEVILMTIGLIAVFIINYNQNVKDVSKQKWISAFGQMLNSVSENIAKQKDQSKTKLMEDFLNAIKQQNNEEK